MNGKLYDAEDVGTIFVTIDYLKRRIEEGVVIDRDDIARALCVYGLERFDLKLLDAIFGLITQYD